MPKFEIESSLPVEAEKLAKDLFCMNGVNYELLPLVRMSAPNEWKERDVRSWPVKKTLLKSYIYLFGFIPIDIHCFNLNNVNALSFDEASKSLMNMKWNHCRLITPNGRKSIVRDVVEYQSRVKLLGVVLKPVYKIIFSHRHRRLQNKYKQQSANN